MKNFKIYGLLLCASFLFSLNSCEKDDEENPITGSILGEWEKNDISLDITVNGVDILDYYTTLGVPKETAEMMVEMITANLDFPIHVEFFDDGNYLSKIDEYQNHNGTYVLDTNNRTLNIDNNTEDAQEFKVHKLNATDFIISATEYRDLDEETPALGEMEVIMTVELIRVQ